jgi:hypothetical protein
MGVSQVMREGDDLTMMSYGADAARFVRTMIDMLGDPESFMLRA